MGRTTRVCKASKGKRNTDVTDLEWGVCSSCKNIFELTEERKVFDGVTTFWLCPKCNGLSDDSQMDKKKGWEMNEG